MAKVFVSYSRKDIEFAKRLTTELQKSELDFWIDWEGIPPTVDWWKEIEKGIEEADVFLFLISPDSAKSKICGQEIDTAVKNGKRIIPIVVREIEWQDTPPQLGHLNYIFFSREDDFETAVKRLMTAIQTDYEWAAAHRRLQVKALDWERNNKDTGFLLRGLDLLDAEAGLAGNSSKSPYPTDLQREFVFESRKAVDKQRRTTTLISIGSIVILAALSIVAVVMAIRATHQARISRAGELAAQAVSQRDSQFDLSLLLSVEAFRVADTIETRSVLLDNTQTNPRLLQTSKISTGGILGLSFASNGKDIISISCAVDFAGLGCPTEEVISWDSDTYQSIILPLSEYTDEFTAVAIHPGGETIAFASADNSITLWNISDRKPVGPSLKATGDVIHNLAISADGRFLASASDNVIIWNIENGDVSGQPIKVDFIPLSVAFSADGRTLAIGGIDAIILWDLINWQAFEGPQIEIKDQAQGLAFSPDAKVLAVAGNNIHLLDISAGYSIDQFREDTGNNQYQSIAFSQDGKMLATGSCEYEDVSCVRGKISLWDLTGNQTIRYSFKDISSTGSGFALSPNGQTIALPGADGSVIFWDLEKHQISGKPVHFPTDFIRKMVYSPDGKTLAVGGDHIYFWDASSGQIMEQPIKNLGDNMVFSPDGNILALGGLDTINLWNIDIGRSSEQTIQGTAHYQISFTFTEDGKKLIVGSSGDKDIFIWDIATVQPVKQLLAVPDGSVTGLAISPDGKTLATAGKSIIFWDLASGRSIGNPIKLQIGEIYSIAFSPDGKTLASGGCTGSSFGFCVQGEIILWDVESRRPIGNPLIVNGYSVNKVVFGQNGKLATESGGVVLWVMDPNAWAISNCQRAGRNFTQEEWDTYFSGEVYPTDPKDATCPQWPLDPESTSTSTQTP